MTALRTGVPGGSVNGYALVRWGCPLTPSPNALQDACTATCPDNYRDAPPEPVSGSDRTGGRLLISMVHI
jgi:hypothetical protein